MELLKDYFPYVLERWKQVKTKSVSYSSIFFDSGEVIHSAYENVISFERRFYCEMTFSAVNGALSDSLATLIKWTVSINDSILTGRR